MSAEIQNECLQVMSLNILREICSSMSKNGFYTITADECTDVSNKEQFTICIRWVDEKLVDHEDMIGLYNVDAIDAICLVAAIRDVLLRTGLKLSHCRGQCYDGTSNMTGSRSGVATQLQAEESRAVLIHCYGHLLNLAIGDTVKQSKVCRDALDVAFEISKLIRFSPKRNLALDCIRVENPTDNKGLNVGISVLSY
ncbi:zinc finger MYM-type protein 1-like [Corticium candelabrum]|uniref:zinc finger MYM-type protein 1-like n=1 Tax=Corticium candelabrum TaxID=121492 RepID=UPI002E2552DA|nr:zinc finger MYM-type protein 1-like [Corticium candelabrum]